MKAGRFLPIAVLALTITASAQDWQHCKPDGSNSFAELKDSVRRVTTTYGYTGLDEKMFNRSGDLAGAEQLNGQWMGGERGPSKVSR
jgi:hypothetical protein